MLLTLAVAGVSGVPAYAPGEGPSGMVGNSFEGVASLELVLPEERVCEAERAESESPSVLVSSKRR